MTLEKIKALMAMKYAVRGERGQRLPLLMMSGSWMGAAVRFLGPLDGPGNIARGVGCPDFRAALREAASAASNILIRSSDKGLQE